MANATPESGSGELGDGRGAPRKQSIGTAQTKEGPLPSEARRNKLMSAPNPRARRAQYKENGVWHF